MIERGAPRLGLALALVWSVVGIAGCFGGGDDLPREAITGRVTLDGQPVEDGSISFVPMEAVAVGDAVQGGGAIKSGRFWISQEFGLIPGKYRVAINAAAHGGKERTKPQVPAAGQALDVSKELIPQKYNAMSELTATVEKGGTNDFEFKLDSK
jgi:hypothetical protein